MMDKELFSKIESVERKASASKFSRMLLNPFRYAKAILFRVLVYKKTKREIEVSAKTFFDSEMHLLLPSSTDIYLTGGKSHESEIRLAKFLMRNLNEKDVFIDVGAHYGYFTLLAAKLVGKPGKVFAFEASPTTHSVLQKNQANLAQVTAFNLAVSDSNSHLTFYEFPNLYSEYNSLDVEQFKNEAWFSAYKPVEVNIKSVILDDFISEQDIQPKIIKIDVEGAEFKVINGLKKQLANHATMVVMEYLSDLRGNEGHTKAEKLLKSLGYRSFLIEGSGELQAVSLIADYMESRGIESDNIVFVKSSVLT